MSYIEKFGRTDLPTTGWYLARMEELEYAEHICELCGKEKIRYVHIMKHDYIDKRIDVGCICAGHMLNDYDTPQQTEYEFKKKLSRKETFMNKVWQVDFRKPQYSDKRLYIRYKKDTLSIYVKKASYDPIINIKQQKGFKSFQMTSETFIAYYNSTCLGKAFSFKDAKEIIFEHIEDMKGY